MRSSYSQNSLYRSCSEMWHIKYVRKYTSPVLGASLNFGTAIDVAIDRFLAGKELDYIKTFDQEWTSSTSMYGATTTVFDNPNIVYSNADFDEDVLLDEDRTTILNWITELNLVSDKTIVELYTDISERKKESRKSISDNELLYFNRCSYISLRRKGHLMLHSFNEQFVPLIEEVLSVQSNSSITSYDGKDTISGKLDFVLRLKGYDLPIILDLKTSAKKYTQEQIDNSEQLAIYAAMEADNYKTDLIGYVVLPKAINKDTVGTCQTCKALRSGRHKTCDNRREKLPEETRKVDKKDGLVRCGGTWDLVTTLNPQVQVLIQKISPETVDRQMSIESQTLDAMNNGVHIRNTKVCRSFFGGVCPYYDLCWKNDDTGLVKKGSK